MKGFQMNEPVKVLQVCAIDSTAWLLLRNQMKAMREIGWDVGLACTEGPNRTKLESDGFRFHPVPIARSRNVLSHLRSVLHLYQIIRQNRYNVVHVHTPVASLVGRMAAKLAGVPLVLYTAHGFYFHENMSGTKRRRHIKLERLFGRLTDHLFTQSAEDGQAAVQEKIMRQDTVTVIGNGVQLERFLDVSKSHVDAWREKLGIPSDVTVIGIVGRVVEEKGYREFFQAATQILDQRQDAAFLVVGANVQGDRDSFKEEIATFLTDPRLEGKVFFTGFTEDIPALMNMMDIFVLPSYREGMPRSIIEAMAAGKPVVATNIRGCREEVVDGETGFLVPVKDVQTLSERLLSLIQAPDLRREMGENGRRRAEVLFHERQVIERLIGQINCLLRDKGAHPQVASTHIPVRRTTEIPKQEIPLPSSLK